ncbi:MAG: hypothetical protein EA391_03465 [Balneolaceae bacterium]|nr:MAG: hypothetical protein EA391_03465 [Balneolaceae bacterium]
MEIRGELEISEEEIDQLEMHSVINVLSVISSQLQLIQMNTKHPEILNDSIHATSELATAARKQNQNKFRESVLNDLEKKLFAALTALENKQPLLNDGSTTAEYKGIFKEILNIISIRVNELTKRWENPDAWETHPIEEFENDFRKFFHALEKNSKGKYRIIYNIAEQEEKDYLVQFKISSDTTFITMPIVLKDVIRDLIANARKYTQPGGTITVGISQKEGKLRFVVEDNGYGIPEDEVNEIVKFGYRGSNVKEKVRTMGGGFGLTKAWYVTRKFGGRMWINSELNRGTKVTIELPFPAEK